MLNYVSTNNWTKPALADWAGLVQLFFGFQQLLENPPLQEFANNIIDATDATNQFQPNGWRWESSPEGSKNST